MTRAGQLSDLAIREAREITATGKVVGVIGVGGHVHITIRLGADDEVTVHPKGAGRGA